MLTHSVIGRGESIGNGGGGGSVGDDNIYRGNTKPVLVLPSDLYFNDEISISDSRSSSCLVYILLLTTINYCPN